MNPVARRLLAMNAFDGILTTLGIVMGFYIAGVESGRAVIVACFSAGFAMAISGFTGAYFTEKAERLREFAELRKTMIYHLKNSAHERKVEKLPILISLVDGFSPFIASIACIIPFFLSCFGILSFSWSLNFSISISFLGIFLIGVFLGKIAGVNKIFLGLKLFLVSIFVGLVLFLLKLLL